MADKADKSQTALTALTVQQKAGELATEAVTRFRNLDAAGRNRLLLAVGFVLACFGALLWYTSRPDWRTLYAGLDPEDARQVSQQLTTAGIPFDVSPDGSTVRVGAPNLDKARLAT